MLHGKYLIVMMGFFATYMGFIYNDFMSLPTRVFDSCYPIEEMTKPESIQQKDHKISELSQ
jgi:V-type H+-transporting ATPase subunit a